MTLRDFFNLELSSDDTIYRLYDYDTEEIVDENTFKGIYPLFYRYEIKNFNIIFEEKVIEISLKIGKKY